MKTSKFFFLFYFIFFYLKKKKKEKFPKFTFVGSLGAYLDQHHESTFFMVDASAAHEILGLKGGNSLDEFQLYSSEEKKESTSRGFQDTRFLLFRLKQTATANKRKQNKRKENSKKKKHKCKQKTHTQRETQRGRGRRKQMLCSSRFKLIQQIEEKRMPMEPGLD